MKFVTKSWVQTQISSFADRISNIFARKTEVKTHNEQKATTTILGHVKLSNSAAITAAGEHALDAVEKNASVEGTLANLIQQQNSNLAFLNSAQYGNLTLNPEVVQQDIGCQWQSMGDVCTVYIQANIKMQDGYKDYILATNLPPKKFGFNPIGFLKEQESGRTYVIWLGDKLYVRSEAHPLTNGGWVRGAITYIRNQ